MQRVKTFKVDYTYFEPGTIVTPKDRLSNLDFGRHYKIVHCLEPDSSDELATCYVTDVETGWDRRDNILTGFLKEVE
jgi:hypothetical protein